MPAPAITCMLVAAVLLAQADTIAGVVLAIIAGIIEFMLPALSTEEILRDGQITKG